MKSQFNSRGIENVLYPTKKSNNVYITGLPFSEKAEIKSKSIESTYSCNDIEILHFYNFTIINWYKLTRDRKLVYAYK